MRLIWLKNYKQATVSGFYSMEYDIHFVFFKRYIFASRFLTKSYVKCFIDPNNM